MQILHVLPQFFVIDSHDRVSNPVGMHGIRLEVQAHIIMGAIASVQNLIKCVEMAGIKVTDIILEQLASAQAVLSEDERTIGVGVLDIGGVQVLSPVNAVCKATAMAVADPGRSEGDLASAC